MYTQYMDAVYTCMSALVSAVIGNGLQLTMKLVSHMQTLLMTASQLNHSV